MTTHSETIAALAAALVKAQAAIQPAIKDKTNPAFRSKYADLGAVWEACREALTANGLSVVQMPVDSEPGRVALTTMLLHSSGEYLSSTISTPLTKNDPQGVGSALTYLRRYALSAMVGVVADEDDDGNAASQRPQAQRTAPERPRLPTEQNGNGSATEARTKFYAQWGAVAGTHWGAVQGFLGTKDREPTTVEAWRDAWRAVQAKAAELEYDGTATNTAA